MARLIGRFRFLKTVLLLCIALQAVSCGTVFYPERRGQPAGRLDPKVVALDAVGLLAFFVPGVIAFAVDFNNGTIYLPPDEYSQNSAATNHNGEWTAIDADAAELTAERITAVIREKTGKTVTLEPGSYDVRPLKNAEQLAAIGAHHSEQAIAGARRFVLFRCQSE